MDEIHKAGLAKLYQQIGDRVAEVDRQIRVAHTGDSAAAIAPVAEQAFAGMGVSIPDDDLWAYAESVAENQPFEFQLR